MGYINIPIVRGFHFIKENRGYYYYCGSSKNINWLWDKCLYAEAITLLKTGNRFLIHQNVTDIMQSD